MVSRSGGDGGDGVMEGRWLLVVAVVAQSSVVSAPLMHVAGGKNLRRRAVAFFFCHGQKVGTVALSLLKNSREHWRMWDYTRGPRSQGVWGTEKVLVMYKGRA